MVKSIVENLHQFEEYQLGDGKVVDLFDTWSIEGYLSSQKERQKSITWKEKTRNDMKTRKFYTKDEDDLSSFVLFLV